MSEGMQIGKALALGALAWFATLMVLTIVMSLLTSNEGVLAAFSVIPAFIVGFLAIRAHWPSPDSVS
jgi:hypothetical protein